MLAASPAAAAPAASAQPASPAASASAGAEAQAAPLPELPRLAAIPRSEPTPAAVQDLSSILERLTSADARTRQNARAALDADSEPGRVEAIRQRLQDLRGSLDREEATRLLEQARKEGRKRKKPRGDAASKQDDAPSKQDDAPPKKGDVSKKADAGARKGDASKKTDAGAKKGDAAASATGDDASKKADAAAKRSEPAAKKGGAGKDVDAEEDDWLDFMLASPAPSDKTWCDLTHLYAMLRMLANVGTTPAMRELVGSLAYFGDLVRIDLQRHVQRLKDHAVPALIEARQHDAKIVQRWAERQLDDLGRAIPGEAVASNDTQVLADVLRAYGRTRDVDAMRVVLSFADSDRVQLRDASRESVGAIGEPGLWQLRDAYLGLTGEKPPRPWSWDRIARELFGMYDRARLAEVHELMDSGLSAAKAGKLPDAVDAFDKVLARVPLYDRRKEMVPAYVARAKAIEDQQREGALEMLRKALRLDPKGDGAPKVEAEIAYLDGMVLLEQGTPDKFVLAHALELDPTHDRARRALQSLEDKAIVQEESRERYYVAAGVGAFALLAAFSISRRRAPAQESPAPPA